MNLSKVQRVQLDMSNDEAYALWCVLDEVYDANEVTLPEGIIILTEKLREMMDTRSIKPREHWKETRERVMKDIGEDDRHGHPPGRKT